MSNSSGFHFLSKLSRQKTKKRSTGKLWLLGVMISLFSVILGWGFAFALSSPSPLIPSPSHPLLTAIEPVPSRYQTGQALYLETCSGCHIPLPAGVLPTETWRRLLEKPGNHYGVVISDLISISQLVIWDYLRTFSRPLSTDEPMPLYVEQSRYFKALHPRVTLPKPTTSKTCVTCHPGAAQFDYRSLTQEWEDAP